MKTRTIEKPRQLIDLNKSAEEMVSGMTVNEMIALTISLSYEYIVTLAPTAPIWTNITNDKLQSLTERKETLLARATEIKAIIEHDYQQEFDY